MPTLFSTSYSNFFNLRPVGNDMISISGLSYFALSSIEYQLIVTGHTVAHQHQSVRKGKSICAQTFETFPRFIQHLL
jgi:hypothetical protein